MGSKVSLEEANQFLRSAFAVPESDPDRVIELDDSYAKMRMPILETHLRPGNLISGPTQMAMADSASYIAIFTKIGITPMAVTSSLNISFLRPCVGKAVMAEARLMKFGRALAVIEVGIRGEGQEKDASHAVVTYALPKPD